MPPGVSSNCGSRLAADGVEMVNGRVGMLGEPCIMFLLSFFIGGFEDDPYSDANEICSLAA